VLSRLDPFQPINCSFGLKDRVFNFGTLVAQLPELLAPDPAVGASPRDAPGQRKGARPGASAKASSRSSTGPGPGAAASDGAPAPPAAAPRLPLSDTASYVDNPAAAKANLKFINPKKVPCTVNFSIQPQNGNQTGKATHKRATPSL